MAERFDVIVAGAGVVGLSVAYALAREGLRSAVLDRRKPGLEASWAGAGLLPAVSDPDRRPSHPTLALRAWSARLYPEWSAALREETGIDNGFRRTGGVDVARTEAEEHALRTTAGRWRVEGIAYERLAPGDFARVEPALDPTLRAVYFLPDRAQVRNPWHLRALAEAVEARGGVVLADRGVEGFLARGDRATGVRTAAGEIEADAVVVAAGAWSGGLLAGLGVRAPTPPVKGQIVLLNPARPMLRRIVDPDRRDRRGRGLRRPPHGRRLPRAARRRRRALPRAGRRPRGGDLGRPPPRQPGHAAVHRPRAGLPQPVRRDRP